MQVIICQINQFTLNHKIYCLDEDTQKQSLVSTVSCDDVGHTIATYARNNKIQKVALGGAPEEYLERFVDDIYTVNQLAYNADNPLTIYIIKGE